MNDIELLNKIKILMDDMIFDAKLVKGGAPEVKTDALIVEIEALQTSRGLRIAQGLLGLKTFSDLDGKFAIDSRQ